MSAEEDDWGTSDESTGTFDEANEALVRQQIPWLALTSRMAINLFIPFINGLMLGFGEIFAHELGLLFGWRSARIFDPLSPTQDAQRRRKWLWII